ncbi:SMI1/KNR4 family protein [Chitinophaga nivalis]|uniref:SMI1/KNR4 family protein n=1 Tax=Chitinophaga nivalis TaxID=2991709 RepID=A0ABT3IQ43_9BACT|nr:SMI1/KNR4 family protein [Chitinophaga nivalis]MCW3464237.1 SMI1/KNR4 family protein [Chitinophaga nivalis]MCW3486073.1 SMI1/KNR4 family protein [Chitinophaga nivalis]
MKTNNSIVFFEYIKTRTEAKWEIIDPNDIFGPSIQPGSKWKPGLTEKMLHAFEQEIGYTFPEPLCNFYRTMNGLDRPYPHLDEDNNIITCNAFYSYPEDLNKIRSQIEWIYAATGITSAISKARNISRIFPIWGHRFIMIDEPEHPILSMFGNDIIFYGFTLGDTFLKDFLGTHGKRQYNEPVVPFWYPGWRKNPKMPKYKRNKGVMTKWIQKMKKQVILRKRALG